MKLALVLGTSQGNAIKQRMNGLKDNLSIDSFDDVPSFISTSMSMHSIYDRILVISNLCGNQQVLQDLHSYWSVSSKSTEVVMLCQKGRDENLAQAFMNQFKNPVTTALLLESTTMKTIVEAITLSTGNLNELYGIKDFFKSEFVDDSMELTPPPSQQQTNTNSNNSQQAQQMLNQAQQMMNQGNQLIQQANMTGNAQLGNQGMQLCNQARQIYNQAQQMLQMANTQSNSQQPDQNNSNQNNSKKKGLFSRFGGKKNEQAQSPAQNPMQQSQNQGFGQNPIQQNQNPMQQNPMQQNNVFGQNLMQQNQNQGFGQNPMQQNSMQQSNGFGQNQGFNQNPMQQNNGFGQSPISQNQNQGFGQNPMSQTDGFGQSSMQQDNSFNQDLEQQNQSFTQDNNIEEQSISQDMGLSNKSSLDEQNSMDLGMEIDTDIINSNSNNFIDNSDTIDKDLSFDNSTEVNNNTNESSNLSFLDNSMSSMPSNNEDNNIFSQSSTYNNNENNMQMQNNSQVNYQNSSPQQQSGFGVANTPDFSNMENDFASDKFETDAIFNDMRSSHQNASPIRTKNIIQQDVDSIDFSDMDIASADEEYRKSNEKQGGVRVVTKEVIRNIGNVNGSIGTISSIYAGRLHKTVVVTGDRGTGITSTALSIAKYMSAKVPILYFDCDVDNHGLLSYINYDTFRAYEQTHMEGVKRCRSSRAFYNCVVNYDNNFDILTTDYSCDTLDEEILTAQGVVAERMNEYGVVVVDCPVEKLHLVSDLILTGTCVICVDATKRGFMNMLCQFENSTLDVRYKRSIVSKGTMFLTKYNKGTDIKKLVKFIRDLYEPENVDWLSMPSSTFFGALNDEFLNSVFEG